VKHIPLEAVATPRTADPMADELIAVRCQLGERDAFDMLVARWHEPLWRYARRLADDPDTADDVVQEIWLRVVRGIARLRDPVRLRAWIFGIARRVLMDRLRSKYGEPGHVALDGTDLPAPADTSSLEDAIDIMHEELAQLPMTEREVLELFYLQGLSLTELAEILGIPVGTVKSRLFRARHALRQVMSDKGLQP
jgi:RNA polymerase sigma factor (sigma-70 family)